MIHYTQVNHGTFTIITGHARNRPVASTSKKKQKPPSLTASRIVAHTDQVAPSEWKSALRTSFSAPGRVASALNVGGMADREAKIHAEIAAEIRSVRFACINPFIEMGVGKYMVDGS